jgi:AraC-like DNA-binding protein
MIISRHAFQGLCLARDRLGELPDDAPSLGEIARGVDMSLFHFIRQFEALFGVTPHQYRIAQRIDRAKRLLARGDRSVTDVCMEVGCSSLGSFSAMFTRRVGATPSTFQRQAAAFAAQFAAQQRMTRDGGRGRRARVQVPANLVRPAVPGCLTLFVHALSTSTSSPAP